MKEHIHTYSIVSFIVSNMFREDLNEEVMQKNELKTLNRKIFKRLIVAQTLKIYVFIFYLLWSHKTHRHIHTHTRTKGKHIL